MAALPVNRLSRPLVTTLIVLAAALFPGGLPPGAHAFQTFDPSWTRLAPEEIRMVENGQIAVRMVDATGTLRQTLVVGTVQAPAQVVYEVFADFDRYAEIFDLKSSRIVESRGNLRMVRCVIPMPWPVGDCWVVNETHLAPETTSLWFEMKEGSIRAYNGAIRIVPRSAAACDVYYAARIDPGIPFLPDWFLQIIQNAKLPDTITAIRRAVARRR